MTNPGQNVNRHLRVVPAEDPAPARSPSDDDRYPVPLTVTALRHPRSLVVQVAGEVDAHTAPEMQNVLEHALAARTRLVVVDLSQVRFLGCAGLTVLVEARRRAEQRTWLRVVATGRVTRRPLSLTELDQYLAVYDSLDAALTAPVGADLTVGQAIRRAAADSAERARLRG